MQLAPGSPVDIMIGEAQVTPGADRRDRRASGVSTNPGTCSTSPGWATSSRGDFGQSVIRTGVPVREMIAEAAPVTLRLNVLAAHRLRHPRHPARHLAAIKRYSWFDYGSMIGSTLGIAMPNYWIGLMLIIVFSLKLGWLPPYGSDSWKSYVLPVAVLAMRRRWRSWPG